MLRRIEATSTICSLSLPQAQRAAQSPYHLAKGSVSARPAAGSHMAACSPISALLPALLLIFACCCSSQAQAQAQAQSAPQPQKEGSRSSETVSQGEAHAESKDSTRAQQFQGGVEGKWGAWTKNIIQLPPLSSPRPDPSSAGMHRVRRRRMHSSAMPLPLPPSQAAFLDSLTSSHARLLRKIVWKKVKKWRKRRAQPRSPATKKPPPPSQPPPRPTTPPVPCGDANSNCIRCPSDASPSGKCRVVTNPLTVYPIYYGKWTQGQKNIVHRFISSITPPANSVGPASTVPLWWNINRWYYDSSDNFVTASVSLGPSYHDSEKTVGPTIDTWQEAYRIVSNAIDKQGLKTDPNGFYAILTDNATSVVGSLSDPSAALCPALDSDLAGYCGWHGLSAKNSTSLNFGLAGNPGVKGCRETESCAAAPLFFKTSASPNGDWQLDSQISILAHEIAEASSDPDLKSWVFPRNAKYKGMDVGGLENADVCMEACVPCKDPSICAISPSTCSQTEANTLWAAKTGSDGKMYNLLGVNGSRYMIQPNYDLRTGNCLVTIPDGP